MNSNFSAKLKTVSKIVQDKNKEQDVLFDKFLKEFNIKDQKDIGFLFDIIYNNLDFKTEELIKKYGQTI